MRIPLLLTIATLAAPAVAQTQHTCSSHSLTKRYLQEQGLSTDLLSQRLEVGNIPRGGTLTVPVVVHVVWNVAAENVPTGTIVDLINELNEDYSASNADLNGVRSTFAGSIADVGIEFCLAQIDPQGDPTTGITRTQTTDTWFNPDTQTNDMKSAPLGHAPWDTERYLNIWICDITSGASGQFVTVGYAYLPTGGIVGSDIDGLVIDYNLGTDLGDRTATHEIGHYLGLLHPFDEDGACVNADGFSDTPTTNSPTFNCSNPNLMKCGQLTQYENFMDYASCNSMFTNQQANYMTGILTGVRSSLLQNNACSITPTGYCIPTSANGTADGDFIDGVQLGSINNVNSGGTGVPTYTNYSATLGTSLARGSTNTVTITGGTFQPDAYAVWIDYDQNELFGTGEKLGEFNTTAVGQTQVINFVVPNNATLGDTRMRVRGVYFNTGEPTPADPCFAYAFGETEDYRITITAPATGPCIPSSANGTTDGDFINIVVLGDIENQSGASAAPYYTDYSASISTALERNGLYGVLIGAGSFATDSYAAWIDYDQDDVFEANEKLGEFATTEAGQTRTITFTVPAGATLGNTTMRVRGVYINDGEPSPVEPCFNHAFGETEDYGIQIIAPVPGYCIPTALVGTGDDDLIDGVQLGDISNLNTGSADGPNYTDYTATISTALIRGTDQILTVTGGDYAPDLYAAWIDYDGDGSFEASEKLGEFASTAPNQTRTIPFSVPFSASLGDTRLRVRGVFISAGEADPIDPCFAYIYGETEDYRIVIETSTGSRELEGQGYSLFPNPSNGLVNLMLPSAMRADISVLDPQGRTVRLISGGKDRMVLDLGGLASGSYVVRIEQGPEVRHLQVVLQAN